MVTKSTTTTVKQNRSAVTGRFVTERYTQSHPNTTVTERNRVPAKPAPSKKGR